MATYTQLLDAFGNPRIDLVQRDDGAFVLTGQIAGLNGTMDVPDFADPDGLAYQVWLKAGNKLGGSAAIVMPREVMGYTLISALTDAQVTALASAKPKDQRLLSARVDPWPESNPKIARIATVLGMKPAAWFDAALAPAS